MKDNTRNIIAVFGFAFMLFMTFGFIFKYCTAVKSYDLTDQEKNITALNEYKTEISKITNEKCKKDLNNFVKDYERTSFNDTVKISDLRKSFLYSNENSVTMHAFFSILNDDSCNLNAENATDEEKKLYNEIVTSMTSILVLEDELVQSLGTSQFAIGSEIYVYDYEYVSLVPSIYHLHRINLLNVIDKAIEIEKVRGEYNG